MAQASRNLRKIRRKKRELSLAYRYIDIALNQRDQARMVAASLEKRLQELEAGLEPKSEVKNEETGAEVGEVNG